MDLFHRISAPNVSILPRRFFAKWDTPAPEIGRCVDVGFSTFGG